MLPDPYPVKPWTSPCRGEISLPGSKSLTNRALVLAAIGRGPVLLQNALFSRDSRLLIDNLDRLGFPIEADEERGTIRIEGQEGRIPACQAVLEVGNAGTAARFLTALVCLNPAGRYRIDGDAEMRERPMKGLLQTLEGAGARFIFHERPDHFPLTVRTNGLQGGNWHVEAAASSQMLSALMMVAPRADGPVAIEASGVRPAFVQMTEMLLRRFGVVIAGSPESGYRISPRGDLDLSPECLSVEPDATAASYFMALPKATGGSLLIRGLKKGMLQGDTALAEVLDDLGMVRKVLRRGWQIQWGKAPRGGARTISFETFSDTFLTLAALAPLFPFPLTLSGIGHTRFQETDRIAAMAEGLRELGTRVETGEDRMTIHPWKRNKERNDNCRVVINTYKDHRVAMSFAVAGSFDRYGDGRPWLSLADPACCGKTFPDFFSKLEKLYLNAHD